MVGDCTYGTYSGFDVKTPIQFYGCTRPNQVLQRPNFGLYCGGDVKSLTAPDMKTDFSALGCKTATRPEVCSTSQNMSLKVGGPIGQTFTLPHALHLDLILVAEPRRTMVSRTDRQSAAWWRFHSVSDLIAKIEGPTGAASSPEPDPTDTNLTQDSGSAGPSLLASPICLPPCPTCSASTPPAASW